MTFKQMDAHSAEMLETRFFYQGLGFRNTLKCLTKFYASDQELPRQEVCRTHMESTQTFLVMSQRNIQMFGGSCQKAWHMP